MNYPTNRVLISTRYHNFYQKLEDENLQTFAHLIVIDLVISHLEILYATKTLIFKYKSRDFLHLYTSVMHPDHN